MRDHAESAGRGGRGSLAARIVRVAGELFDSHGVDGTSLQMIADAAGVGKAAVYYHFKTKDEIVSAVHAHVFAEFYAAIDDAEAIEAAHSRADALKSLIPRLVRLAVNGRRAFSRLLSDPAIAGITANDEQLKELRRRFDRLVTAASPTPNGSREGRSSWPRSSVPSWNPRSATSITRRSAPSCPGSCGRSSRRRSRRAELPVHCRGYL